MHGNSRRGFVFMEVAAGKEEDVIERLLKLESVEECHLITGEYDILAIVRVKRGLLTDSTGDIVELVRSKIRQIPGVVDTETYISQEEYVKRQEFRTDRK